MVDVVTTLRDLLTKWEEMKSTPTLERIDALEHLAARLCPELTTAMLNELRLLRETQRTFTSEQLRINVTGSGYARSAFNVNVDPRLNVGEFGIQYSRLYPAEGYNTEVTVYDGSRTLDHTVNLADYLRTNPSARIVVHVDRIPTQDLPLPSTTWRSISC